MTELVTLTEAKSRLSYEYEDKDNDIRGMTDAIESYLFTATGIDWAECEDEKLQAQAKEYVLSTLYNDYYQSWTELERARLQYSLQQLKVRAVLL